MQHLRPAATTSLLNPLVNFKIKVKSRKILPAGTRASMLQKEPARAHSILTNSARNIPLGYSFKQTSVYIMAETTSSDEQNVKESFTHVLYKSRLTFQDFKFLFKEERRNKYNPRSRKRLLSKAKVRSTHRKTGILRAS
ncbi:hypothetical protein QQF64_032883 [Cirrhinus molitorella]|uniref:Ribosomal protein S10 n=1 Tax=Cirrhinus molitorella TaxID=172907 RepID=A0ABR3MSH0_9TELE